MDLHFDIFVPLIKDHLPYKTSSLWAHGLADIRSPSRLHHSFVDPMCSFVTSQLKLASQPDYLRIFRQLVRELAGQLTV